MNGVVRRAAGLVGTIFAAVLLAGVAHVANVVPVAMAVPGDPCDPGDPSCEPPEETGTITVTKTGFTTRATVSSAPSGISCGATCSATFDADSTVTLTATFDAGFGLRAGSWSGCASSSGNTCTVTVGTADTPVTLEVADAQDPSLILTSPAPGAYRGSIFVAASASDANGIDRVRFRVDGSVVLEDTTNPYSFSWNSIGRTGSVTLSAEAVDSAGRATSRGVTIMVDNTNPTGAIDAPAAGAVISAPTTVTAAATDVGTGVSNVTFWLRDHPTAPTWSRQLGFDTSAPYAAPLEFTGLPGDGDYYLVATIADRVNNFGTSPARSITIDREAPIVGITSPDQGELATSSTVDLAALAHDATSGPPSIAWAYASAGGSTFTSIGSGTPFTWDVTSLPDGTYTVRATATDGAGLTTAATADLILDRSAPTAQLGPVPAVAVSRVLALSWSGADSGSGVASFDVRSRSAAAGASAFGPWSMWRTGMTATGSSFTAVAGSSYCFAVRAYDAAGHRGGWSPTKCTAVPLDDRALTASGTWTRNTSPPGDARYYERTFSRSSSVGAQLTRSGIRALKVTLLVTRCTSCGKVQVLWNGRAVRTIDLATSSPTALRKQLVTALTFTSIQSGTLTLRQVSSGRIVEIDGVAVRKV